MSKSKWQSKLHHILWFTGGLIAASALPALLFRAIFNALQQKTPEDIWGNVAFSAGLALTGVVLECTVVFLVIAFWHAVGPKGEEEESRIRLKGIVLFVGMVAGLSIGLLVGAEAWKHLWHEKGAQPDIYTLVTHVFGPAIAAHILVALLVAVGALVFVFEHTIANYMARASSLAKSSKTFLKRFNQLAPRVQAGIQGVLDLGASILRIQAPARAIDTPLVTAAARYLGTWVAKIGTDAPRLEPLALRALCTAYLSEEVADVASLRLVTNSRNYTALLVATLEAIRKSYPNRPVHFYTATPAGPTSLLNWPHEQWQRDKSLQLHRNCEFISAYMLYVRELVHWRSVQHARWVWTRTDQPQQEGFRAWGHYEQDDNVYGEYRDKHVFGVPVALQRFAAVSGIALERLVDDTNYCIHAGPDKVQARKAALALPDLFAYPIISSELVGGHDWKEIARTIRCQIAEEAKTTLAEVRRAFDTQNAQGEHPGRLTPPEEDRLRRVDAWVNQCSNPGARIDGRRSPRVGWLVLLLQSLDAALHAGAFGPDSPSWPLFTRLECLLTRLKWSELWEAEFADGNPPKFEAFFRQCFHSRIAGARHGAYTVCVDRLGSDLSACAQAGPEFALIGVQDDQATDHVLRVDGQRVRFVLGFSGTIGSPWRTCEMSVHLPGSQSFANCLSALEQLLLVGRSKPA